jgi:hypothetical protein
MAFTPGGNWGQGLLLTGLSPGSSETGFEAVITKANLPTSALDTGLLSLINGGGDFRLSTDINGANQLPLELKPANCVTSANPSNTKFIAWVRFPTYASGTRSVYAFWNKAGESQPAASAAFGSEDVWQDNESVWHLDDLTDSAGNATSLTTVGTPSTVDGVVGDGKRFASDSDYLYTSTVGVVEDDSFNISFWYKRQTGDERQSGAFIGIADSSDPFNNFGVFSRPRFGDRLILQIYSRDTNASPIDAFEIPSFPEGDSVFISVNQNSSGSSIVGIHNGTTYTDTSTARLLGTTPDRLSFNRVMDSSPEGGGLNVLDEVRLTSPGNTKSSDRVELEYDNQSNPSSFWTAGAVFVPTAPSISVTATLGTISYSSNDTSVSVTGSVDVVATLGTISYASNDAVITTSGTVDVTATLGTISYTSNNPSVSVTGIIPIAATLGTISYTSNNVTVFVQDGQDIGVVTASFRPNPITVNFRG